MRPVSRVARVIPQGGSSQVEKKQLVIGAEGWDRTSPFLFLSEDWFGKPKGFETHPHRGMQRKPVDVRAQRTLYERLVPRPATDPLITLARAFPQRRTDVAGGLAIVVPSRCNPAWGRGSNTSLNTFGEP